MSFDELQRIHADCAQVMLDYQTYRFSAPSDQTNVHPELRLLLDRENQRINRRLEAVLHWLMTARRRAEGVDRLDRLRFAPDRNLEPVPERDREMRVDLPEEVDRLLARSADLVRRVEALTLPDAMATAG